MAQDIFNNTKLIMINSFIVYQIDENTKRAYTYEELRTSILHLSAILRQLGVTRGDVVCLCSVNSAEYLIVMYGVMETGAIITTMNPAFTQRRHTINAFSIHSLQCTHIYIE